ncbi:hypothetical protein JQX08_01875 [Pseudomonas sp. UL073]|uniref:Chemotaxis protein n=1 Tax=Zestomonas insulae TaxID=2809017 RepID=A0ABS2I9I9_9GAMM|nr:hypothetical protein [Pseudomonas insulae]
MRVQSVGLVQSLASAQQRRSTPATTLSEAMAGVRVTLSELGRSKAASKDSDIDDSSLPDAIKASLKLIRALKQQIADKLLELQAVMREQALDKEARLQRTSALQGELAVLNGALVGAMADLAKAVKDAGLDAGQMAELSQLSLR